MGARGTCLYQFQDGGNTLVVSPLGEGGDLQVFWRWGPGLEQVCVTREKCSLTTVGCYPAPRHDCNPCAPISSIVLPFEHRGKSIDKAGRWEIGTYWCARDLATRALGNHHFLLLIGDDNVLSRVPRMDENGIVFCTVGGFAGAGGKLVCQFNDGDDVKAVREAIDPGEHTVWWKPDLDLEEHRMDPPPGIDYVGFIVRVIECGLQYQENQGRYAPSYASYDENCAAWANTLFKALGVSDAKRRECGEFWGIDVGEEDEFRTDIFLRRLEAMPMN